MRKAVTQATRFKIQKMLERVTTIDDGCVVYDADWNDTKIADKFSVSRKTVSNTRMRTFGKLAAARALINDDARLIEIELRLKRLESWAMDHSSFLWLSTSDDDELEGVSNAS